MHLPGARPSKTMHPAVCQGVHFYVIILKIWKKYAPAGYTGPKTCAPATKMCTPGAGCTLNTENLSETLEKNSVALKISP